MTAERRTELDSVRVLVVVGLVFFHTALVFDARDDFYVKNAETTPVTLLVSALGVLWAMPLLFFLAGLGARHSLRRRGAGGYAAERLRRLGVPLVFGTVVLVPLPQWLRQRADPAFHESYPEFLPRFFDLDGFKWHDFPFVFEGRHFEFGHLWFLLLLLTFCLVLVPLVRWGGGWGPRLGDRAAAFAERRPGAVLLPAVPLAAVCALAGLEEQFAGWHRAAYLLFFLSGFVFAGEERFRAALRRDLRLLAISGVVLFLSGGPLLMTAGGDPFTDLTPQATAGRALFGVTGWCWLTAILGFLDRRGRSAEARSAEARSAEALPERAPRRWYAYLSEAVLPLYVLHQPVVVAVAFVVIGWEAPIAVKFPVIGVVSLLLIFAVYDLLVRRTAPARFLFGLRPGGPGRP
ncbi:acyltransferase family protein [Planomonospora sp. ID82291]|uniref:acyltransferase family protein n=1 Tax=Planomonospora sp. ID82291 TaxID=2738136 RepID=UPI0018C403A2|nr:acyltransferase family protein [Planomonospora sp. ID82291]MBG0813126.1 acyltransferase family protein [Planomonospora sp. ID82291]